jgi:hypothetical protein
MKNYFLFIAAIILCTNCQKREVGNIQESAESFNPITVEATADVDDIIIQSVKGITIQAPQMEGKAIQETIENYSNPPFMIYDRKRGLFAFQIEGNFTGSGNREIIAFYKVEDGDINSAFCFVCDVGGERIENVYPIKYGTIVFAERNDKDTGLVEIINLGRTIIYKDRIIGRVSDFNGNGREELYLYAVSGMNIKPYFFEFNGIGFESMIDLGSPDAAPIISIDPIEKVITLSIKHYLDDLDVDLIEDINSYIWDDTVHQYEVIASEIKKYKWNRTLREYEEINP